jgi:16S rRNA (uracil1498-N3)-methyltransferase
MILFFSQEIQGQKAVLSAEESRHCMLVLRKKKGDSIHFTDGKGNLYEAEILEENPKKCTLQIIKTQNNPQKRSFYTHLAIAPTKNIDRMEWLVEKLVEIGIDEISFFLGERSERKQLNISRLEKIALSAIKQSLKFTLPKLNDLRKFSELIKSIDTQQKFIAYLPEEKPQLLKNQLVINSSYTIFIGPEGDFSPNEVKSALANGFTPVSLGESRLRTETAGLVACHTIQVLNEN